MPLTIAQLQMRRTGVGASETAAIVGLSPWQTALDVWLRKVSAVGGEFVTTAAQQAGHDFERAVGTAAARDHGWAIRWNGKTLRHALHRWLLATPDFYVLDGDRRKRAALGEVKTTIRSDDWGEEYSDQIPAYYRIQVQQQLTVVRSRQPQIELCVVPVQFWARRERRVYEVRHSPALEEAIIEAVHTFWTENVLADEPPDADPAHPTTLRWLSQMRQLTDQVTDAPAECARWAQQMHEAQIAIKDAERRKDEAEAHLRAWVGDDRGIRGAWGTYTFASRRGRVDDAAVIAELAERLELDDNELRELREEHRRPSYRAGRLTYKR